jgi:hypothetical protein
MNNLAPIVLFVYNRPVHTKKTLQALQKNTLSIDSEIFIYADAAKNDLAQKQVDEVRELISDISGFKKVTVIKQEKNIGLANSIISGVTEIVNKYGKVIVVEDDLVTSRYFLTFMNEALNFYSGNKDVWHISGWNYPIEAEGLADTFLWRTMNCWGWATWADRWQYFEKNTDELITYFSKEDIKRFNLDGVENFWSQILANKAGKINTWAIYWAATIFRYDGLCVNPTISYVDNIGLDGSGVHCDATTAYKSNMNTKKLHFCQTTNESKLARERVKKFYKSQKRSFFTRIVNKFSRTLFGKNILSK